MIVLSNSQAVAAISLPAIRCFVSERMTLMTEDGQYDPDEQGLFILIEPGDLAEAVQAHTGCPLLTSCFGDAQFGDEDFAPMFEYVEDHGDFYEIVYIFNDSGFAHIVIVPKGPGIDPRLIRLCLEYA